LKRREKSIWVKHRGLTGHKIGKKGHGKFRKAVAAKRREKPASSIAQVERKTSESKPSTAGETIRTNNRTMYATSAKEH